VSKVSSFPKLKLAKPGDIKYDDIEEIDLSNDSPPIAPSKLSNVVPRAFHKLYDLHSKVGVERSFRLLKQPPSSVYASGTQSDFSFIHGPVGKDQIEEGDAPSELLGMEDLFDYDAEEASEILEPGLPKAIDSGCYKVRSETPEVTESFANDIFDFSAFGSESRLPSSSKRDAPSSPSQPDAKRVKEDEKIPERILPSWVYEVDADLVKYFEGSVDFV
jgi:hypothetical protein